MKYTGCAYYPEYWGLERLEIDARLMQEAGINLVRIGEFAWSRMEPQEGVFTLDWLHKTVDVLAEHGISVLMCTPTPTPPAWLTSQYPDTLLVHADGRRAKHGNRRHYCPASPAYRRHTERIVTRLVSEMSRHKNIIGWQIDNELGPEMGWCYCETCQARFAGWLKEKYDTLENLNTKWRTGFWSLDYFDWAQVRLASDSFNDASSRGLDSRRFWNMLYREYCAFQVTIIRREHPGVIVTTNGMGPIYTPLDDYALFANLDVACTDLYFDIGTLEACIAQMNVYRSIRPGQPFWITETGVGAIDWNHLPDPRQFRAWAWSAWAHGAEAHLVFRWRSCLSAQEQELQGVLEHSGLPRKRYQAVKNIYQEFAALRPALENAPLPEAHVAIIQDYETLWGYEAARCGKSADYTGLVYQLHRLLTERNLITDLIPPQRDLAGYKLILLPATLHIGADFAARLTRAVENGASVLALGPVGARDEYDNYLDHPAAPEHLQGLFGLKLHGGMFLESFVGNDEALAWPREKSTHRILPLSGGGSARRWIGDVELAGGAALMTFADDLYAGQPAVVESCRGAGRAVYAATLELDDATLGKLLDHLLEKTGAAPGFSTPRRVEAVRRGNLLCFVNHTDQPVTVSCREAGRALLGSCMDGQVYLDAYGVALLKME
jgi:beta-galactosidase